MSEPQTVDCHSAETMQLLKRAALRTHVEDFAVPGEISRRGLLKTLMGASAALALGVSGCDRMPRRKIVSRVTGPEYQKPGKPLYYSSTWTEGCCPYGLVIKTLDGRPIKIEGNPEHPLNRGSASAAMQASILSLYDPDRRGPPLGNGEPVSWEAADEQVEAALRAASSVVLMTRSQLGPAERGLIEKFLQTCGNGRHFVHEAVHDGPRRLAWGKIYGADGELLPRFDRANVILSVDCDFLATDGTALENIRRFARGRSLEDKTHGQAAISRLYVVEPGMTLTGSNADHRMRLRPSALGALANALRKAIGGSDDALQTLGREHGLATETLSALVKDLRAGEGKSLVLAGGHLPESVHAAVALLNDDLGASGRTLEWNSPPATLPVLDPAEVESALQDGVDVLICLGVNPVYDWPGGDFRTLMSKAGLTIGHGLYADETVSACGLSLPSNHNLESWNDAEARPGLRTLCQPVIGPLFDTRQEAESLLVWTKALSAEDDPIRELEDWHDYVRRSWIGEPAEEGKQEAVNKEERAWEDSLRVGGQLKARAAPFPALDRGMAEGMAQSSSPGGEYELVIHPHHALYDGRFANNGWLQELPDPISKLVWDNAASVSPMTAEQLGVVEGDMVTAQVGSRSVELPVLIQRGMADGVVVTTLGHGRTKGGLVVQEAGGANVSLLLGQGNAATPRLATDAKIQRTGGSRKLVRTQKQFSMHGRPIVLDGTLQEYRGEADFVKHKRHLPTLVDLYEPYDYSKGHKWALAIDLGSCVGCSACMTACQAENNIPIVGREECGVGREMHWLRIDRYEEGDADNPTVHHQPMLCQHCDQAPCESVCPVNATTHSPEGLNEMTYNRCVGTRYCSNNCPYKVRRFNFRRYQEGRLRDPVQELVFNPQVTVRGIGVMEKCTFCIQRINEAKFRATDRRLADGAVVTACQQACPAGAIVFGDVNDPDSRIAKGRASGRAFQVLEELNVKPNVTYLARVRNPNGDVRRESNDQAGSHRG